MAFQLTQRQRRWLDALLILSTIAVGFVVIGFAGEVFRSFGDIILIFFLAWLLAFILVPIATFVDRFLPGVPRAVSVILVYGAVIGLTILAVFLVANGLVSSLQDFLGELPTIREDLPTILAPVQERLTELGFGVDVVATATTALENLDTYLQQLAGPLQEVAVASIGVIGNILFIVIFSVYIAADGRHLSGALYRFVPPGREAELRVFQTSVYRSFGGFIRGQFAMGAAYAGVALVTSLVTGLPFAPVTSVAAGILMAIPFFGPFVSWLPPVLVAIFSQPDALVPTLILMLVGWFLVMNVLQPRVMQEAVGLHPIAVLASVLIGVRIAGIPGAIFGIPIAAVISTLFFYYFRLYREPGTIAERAAQRIEAREGRTIRIPREPTPGIDPDVEDDPGATDAAIGAIAAPAAGETGGAGDTGAPGETGSGDRLPDAGPEPAR